MKPYSFTVRLLPLLIVALYCAAFDAAALEGLTGKTPKERLGQLGTLIQNKPANTEAVLSAAFYTDTDAEVMIAAGQRLIPTLKAAELQKALHRVVEFPSPLPAFNLGVALVRQFAPDELGAQLATMTTRQNWWEQRNAVIVISCAQDARYIPILQQVYNASTNRAVKLEALVSLAGMKNPQSVKFLENIATTTKVDGEKATCLRMLSNCATESDLPWMLAQLSGNSVDSVVGAWSVAQLAKTLPKAETHALLKNTLPYPRRAGLLLMQRLATKEQWLEQLKGAKGIPYPDVLEAIGNYFYKNPTPEAAKFLLEIPDNMNHKDFRVTDAWCRATGACAGIADDATKDFAFKQLSQRVQEILGPKLNDARKKERRESTISAIYGLASLGTPPAREMILRLSMQASDDVVAIYAAYDALRDPAPEAEEKFRTLCAGLRDKGPAPFQRATQLLSCMTDRAAIEILFDFLAKAPDEPSRMGVREALGQMTGHDFGNDPAPWQAWWKAANNFAFLENKFKVIKKDGPKITKPMVEGSYDVQSLDIMELRKEIPAALTRFKGDDDTEASVTAGLRWLAEHQDPDGKWNGTNFQDLSFGKKNDQVALKFGRQNVDISLTGLSILAFLASNHTPVNEKSIYRETVNRALDWCVSHQLDDGSYEEVTEVAKGGANYFNYEQGICTLALSEAYGMTKADNLKVAAQRGLDKIISSQSPGDGWRYVPRLYSDTSVVGWMINAIKSGLMSGLDVDPRYRPSTLAFFKTVCNRPKFTEDPKDVTDDYDKTVGSEYKEEEATGHYMQADPRLSTSGTAITGANMIFMGYARSYPFCIGAANHLKKNLPQLQWHKAAAQAKYAVPVYYYYYGTLFMHQMGGDDWTVWNNAIKTSVVSAQLKAPDPNVGAFPAIGFDGEVGGQIYSTSMCVLTLETYYRYLPMLWFR
jgi:hypothetical protein